MSMQAGLSSLEITTTFIKVGSCWSKVDKSGNQYLSGSIEVEDLEHSIKKDKNGNDKAVAYVQIRKNKNKNTPDSPDFSIYQIREVKNSADDFLAPVDDEPTF